MTTVVFMPAQLPARPADLNDVSACVAFRVALAQAVQPHACELYEVAHRRRGVCAADTVVMHLELEDSIGARVAEALTPEAFRVAPPPKQRSSIVTVSMPVASAVQILDRLDSSHGSSRALRVPVGADVLNVVVIAARGIGVFKIPLAAFTAATRGGTA